MGKSTLVRSLVDPDWPASYLTLDDRTVLDAALADPDGLVSGAGTPVILDEVQRAPELLRAIKRVVDRHRVPGAFVLTGSANLLALKHVSETLAGRAAVHELMPLSLAEGEARRAPTPRLEGLFQARTAREYFEVLEAREAPPGSGARLAEQILRGGYPTPFLMTRQRSRSQWFDSYRQTYLERDLRDIAQPEHLPDFGRLLTLTALRSGQIANLSELAREVGLAFSTLRRYVALLETTYQIWFLRPYLANIGKRLVKSPKLYHTDAGLAGHLLGFVRWEEVRARGRDGAFLETWVASELRKLLPLCERRTTLWYWRTSAGREVDFVLERGDDLVALELKGAAHVGAGDLAGLRAFRQAFGARVRLAAVLYMGETAVALDEGTLALPLSLFL